jgi:hypothetical protein
MKLLRRYKMPIKEPDTIHLIHSSKLMISPEGLSDIDIRNDVMHENRSED